MLAFLPTLGFQEMFVLLVLGVLLFGRNLPDVGRTLGRTVANLRRGFQEFKDQMNRDENVRELRDAVHKTRDEVARAGAVPRALANPGAALKDLAHGVIAGDAPKTPTPPADAPAAGDGESESDAAR